MFAILLGVICDAAAIPSGEEVESNDFSSFEIFFVVDFFLDTNLESFSLLILLSSSEGDNDLTVLLSLIVLSTELLVEVRGKDIVDKLFESEFNKLCIFGVVVVDGGDNSIVLEMLLEFVI